MATPESKDDKPRDRESMPSQRSRVPMRSGWGLSPWEPWGFRRMFDDFDRMFDEMRRELFGRRFEGGPMTQRGGGRIDWTPRLDVEDTGRELVIEAELPGVDPKDVNIECTEDGLTIAGERREERTEEQGGYRSYGRFFRQIPMPSGCDMDKADASFKNGLLRIRLPKAQAESTKRIPIRTETELSTEHGQRQQEDGEGGQRAA